MDLRSLEELKQKGLYRELRITNSPNDSVIFFGRRRFVNFSSNNYLALATHPKILQKSKEAIDRWGAGSGASRLISGTLGIHDLLEKKIARFKKEEEATVFSSGYLASLGLIPSLLDEKDVVILDRYNHACLVDAARLSRAKLWVYPHKDLTRLKAILERAKNFKRKLVVTDAYFSMDGDVAPLTDLVELCRDYGADLMIDEAHSTGVYGKHGAGLTEEFGLQGEVQIVMGTLSKALGSAGGYIAGRSNLKEILINSAKSFIYTTAPVPAASAAALAAIEILEKNPQIRESLWANVKFLREGLRGEGFGLMDSEGPIIPIQMESLKMLMYFKEGLEEKGFFVPAIRPPTVPEGSQRLRISLMSSHKKEELEAFLKTIKELRDKA